MRYIFLSLFLILFLLTACSSDDTGYKYPLQVGNSWTYLRIQTEEATKSTYIDTLFATIDSTLITPDGQRCYRLRIEESWAGEDYIGYQYLANLSDGLYGLGGGGMGFQIKGKPSLRHPLFASGSKAPDDDILWYEHPHLILPKDPKPGTIWIQEANSDWAEVHYKIEDRETVMTDLGSYNCHVKRSAVMIDPDSPYINRDYYGVYGLTKFFSESVSEQYNPETDTVEDILRRYEVRLIETVLN